MTKKQAPAASVSNVGIKSRKTKPRQRENSYQAATSGHGKTERDERDGDLKVVARFGKEPASRPATTRNEDGLDASEIMDRCKCGPR